MPEYLLISPSASAHAQVSWVVLGEGGDVKAHPDIGSYSQAASMAPGRRVVLLVPGKYVLLTEVHLPTQVRQKILKAVPYALEDQVADDVENLHFALGARLEGGTYPVAVVARERMEQWLVDTAEAGLVVNMMVPDILLVPLQDDGWSAVVATDTVLLRTGPHSGFSIDHDNVDMLFSLFASEQDQLPTTFTQYRSEGSTAIAPLIGCESKEKVFDGGILGLLATNFSANESINLLQGEFSRKERISQLWRPWRATAALLLVGLLLLALQNGLHYNALKQEHAALTKRAEAIYREVFPSAKRVVNPRAQMQQQLVELRKGQGGGDSGFLDLLGLCAPVLRASSGVQLQGASYRDGRVELNVTAKSLQVLDQLKQQLSSTGHLVVEIQSATASANQEVKSRLRVTRVGA